jgi:hypothetical protein
MPVLLTPSPWAVQPQTAVRFNRAHPLAAACIFYALPVGTIVVDLVSGNYATPSGSGCSITVEQLNGGTANTNQSGIVCATNTTSGAWRWAANATGLDAQAINDSVSIFALAMPRTAAVATVCVASYEASFGDGFGLVTDDNAQWGPGRVLRVNGGTYTTNGVNNELTSSPTSKLHFFGGGWNGSNQFGYFQGVSRNNTATGTTPGTHTNRATVFGGRYSGAATFNTSVALGMAFNRILTLDEYRLLYNNPWGLVAQQAAKVWVAVASGSNNSITAPLGSETLNQLIPTFDQTQSIVAPLGTETLQGLVPTFTQGNTLAAPLGTETLGGLVPLFAQGQSLTAPLGVLTIQGLLPTFDQTEGIVVPLGLLQLVGLVPTFDQSGQPIVPVISYGLGASGGGKTVDVEELEVFKRVARRVAQGWSLDAILKDLRSDEPETPAHKAAKKAPKPAAKTASIEPRVLDILREARDLRELVSRLEQESEERRQQALDDEDDADLLILASRIM